MWAYDLCSWDLDKIQDCWALLGVTNSADLEWRPGNPYLQIDAYWCCHFKVHTLRNTGLLLSGYLQVILSQQFIQDGQLKFRPIPPGNKHLLTEMGTIDFRPERYKGRCREIGSGKAAPIMGQMWKSLSLPLIYLHMGNEEQWLSRKAPDTDTQRKQNHKERHELAFWSTLNVFS